jgi:PAS domain S-box-containing protein
LLLLVGTIWLMLMLLRWPQLYRRQAGALVLGVLAPWVGNGTYLSGLGPVPNLDLTPFAFTFTGLVFAWGLFRFRLLDLVPIARRAVIEGMRDGVIVLDTHNRVVDLNPAVRSILRLPAAANLIGQPAVQVLGDYTDLIKQYRDVLALQTEITLEKGDAFSYYDLHISPLTDQHGHPMGRVVVLHDITSRKQAEATLRHQKQCIYSPPTPKPYKFAGIRGFGDKIK